MRDLAIGVSVTQSALCDQRRECEVLRFAQDDTPFFNLEAVPIAGRRRPTSGAVQETRAQDRKLLVADYQRLTTLFSSVAWPLQ